MKKLVYVSLALLSLVVTACKEGVDFDQDAYNDLVNRSFPVENVDPTHQWATVVNVNANISVSGDYGETYEAGIYMDNPIGAEEATLLYEEDVVSGGEFSVTVSRCQLPKQPSTLVSLIRRVVVWLNWFLLVMV